MRRVDPAHGWANRSSMTPAIVPASATSKHEPKRSRDQRFSGDECRSRSIRCDTTRTTQKPAPHETSAWQRNETPQKQTVQTTKTPQVRKTTTATAARNRNGLHHNAAPASGLGGTAALRDARPPARQPQHRRRDSTGTGLLTPEAASGDASQYLLVESTTLLKAPVPTVKCRRFQWTHRLKRAGCIGYLGYYSQLRHRRPIENVIGRRVDGSWFQISGATKRVTMTSTASSAERYQTEPSIGLGPSTLQVSVNTNQFQMVLADGTAEHQWHGEAVHT